MWVIAVHQHIIDIISSIINNNETGKKQYII